MLLKYRFDQLFDDFIVLDNFHCFSCLGEYAAVGPPHFAIFLAVTDDDLNSI